MSLSVPEPSSQTAGVVLITTPSQQEAERLAIALVEKGLAACANFFPVQSVYRWQGNICNESEWQLIIKTELRLIEPLIEMVSALHSYDAPEIIALPITAGSDPYLSWIQHESFYSP